MFTYKYPLTENFTRVVIFVCMHVCKLFIVHKKRNKTIDKNLDT